MKDEGREHILEPDSMETPPRPGSQFEVRTPGAQRVEGLPPWCGPHCRKKVDLETILLGR
jgi:hypothetical protein